MHFFLCYIPTNPSKHLGNKEKERRQHHEKLCRVQKLQYGK